MKLILSTLLLVCGAPTSIGDDVAFADFGKAFLKTHFKTEDPTTMPVDKLREQHCVHGAFGIFDISYPAWELADKQHIDDLRAVTTALVQVQIHWIDWLAKGDKAADAPKADAEALIAWIKTWKPPEFSKAETATNKDLFALLGAKEAQTGAAKRLGEFIMKPDVLGAVPKNSEVLHILFAPTRLEFIGLLGYAGLLDPAVQASLWTKQTTTWTNFWIDWTMVLALEYPPWAEDKEFKTGLSMNKFETTGMIEHTIQQAMLSFLWMVYGDNDGLYLNQAQAMNMAIEVCGEINALEGDGGRGTTGAKTDPYEKFVPGGNPNGGTLPAIPAAPGDMMKVNPWHDGLGKDHFAKPLRHGQKEALKQMQKEKPPGLDASLLKDKNAHFLIVSADQAKKYVVSAPFMGKFSKLKPYPPHEVIADYKEFFRAYKCGFYYWMQTMGDKAGVEPSAAKYKDLLKKLATRDPAKTYDELVAEVYGIPLSGKNGETDSLEWRYLEWLGKGK